MKLMKFLVEIILVPLLLGWLLLRFPETFDGVVPWLALAVLWHLTWQYILSTGLVKSKAIIAYQRWGAMWVTWIIIFCAGGGLSLGYWYSIQRGIAKLVAVQNEHSQRNGQKEAPPEPPVEPFAVSVEYRIISGGGALNTGLYLRRTMAGRCTLIPIGTALYFRIKNLKPTKAFITGYEVAEDTGTPWGRIARVNPKYGDLLFALKKGQVPDAGTIGGTIPLPNFTNRLLGMNVLQGEVDFTHAELLTGDMLDDKVGPTPIEALDTIRGWTFFESNWEVRGNLKITLVDEDRKMHSYKSPVPSYLDTKTPDIMPHTFTITAFVDASKCPIQPTVPQWPLPPNWSPPW
jgi:hypothetical protein